MAYRVDNNVYIPLSITWHTMLTTMFIFPSVSHGIPCCGDVDVQFAI